VKKLVLVVCTGNICRSPMAAGLLRRRLGEAGLAGEVEVASRGFYVYDGQPASAAAVALLGESGLDISQHASATLTADDLRRASVVLVMEEAHRRSIFYTAPEHMRKVVLWAELAGEHGDVPDPYGRDRAAYASAYALIDRLLTQGWPRLMEKLGYPGA
jgi:protein-tyrosine phosphatase